MSMPSKKKIHEFWTSSKYAHDVIQRYNGILANNIDEEFGILPTQKVCYACGYLYRLQRCHILAKQFGGSNSCENLHLLCSNCHWESERFSGDLYWAWLFHKFDTYWQSPFEWLRKDAGIKMLMLHDDAV